MKTLRLDIVFIWAVLALSSCTKVIEREIIREKEVIKHDTVIVDKSDPNMYEWEQKRNRAPVISDMVLCYGGSPIRHSTDWPSSRFSEYVSCKDENSQEHWLFDSFLALEWRDVDMEIFNEDDIGDLNADGAYALTGGHDRHSAKKEGWQRQLDFWFTDADNGFNGLDKAVSMAAERLGEPSVKRRIVMFLPDPLPYEIYDDPSSSSIYWGEIDGRAMDFSKDEDRLTAYRWYIDSARKLFDKRRSEGMYSNIELIGFYILSEDLKHPAESYTDYAQLYNCIAPLADYLHSVNEYLYWIPYSSAPGRSRGWDLGIDYIWLQPNYYEHGGGYLNTALKNIINDGLGMEIEFDRKALYKYDGQYDSATYSQRMKDYLSRARSSGFYGERPFTYYIMTDWNDDVLKLFRTSSYAKDRELYYDFCRFVTENPLRDKLK